MLKKMVDLFIFSSLFIGLVAIVMITETNHLLQLSYNHNSYLLFVFFSTICSYNVHWHYTPADSNEKIRARWTQEHKSFNIFLIIFGAVGAIIFAIPLINYWFWLSIAVFLTFLYTAPKLPLPFAPFLRRIALGKTIFLAAVWTYVTAILPTLLAEQTLSSFAIAFIAYRFFFIYAICIIFDYRDRKQDRQEGIRSMVTYFSERGIKILFYLVIALALVALLALNHLSMHLVICLLLFVPVLATAVIFSLGRNNKSDYFYYFILDGLMMASALFTPFLSI